MTIVILQIYPGDGVRMLFQPVSHVKGVLAHVRYSRLVALHVRYLYCSAIRGLRVVDVVRDASCLITLGLRVVWWASCMSVSILIAGSDKCIYLHIVCIAGDAVCCWSRHARVLGMRCSWCSRYLCSLRVDLFYLIEELETLLVRDSWVVGPYNLTIRALSRALRSSSVEPDCCCLVHNDLRRHWYLVKAVRLWRRSEINCRQVPCAMKVLFLLLLHLFKHVVPPSFSLYLL